MHTLRLWARLGLKPLLATADCNVAVDNIAEGLLAKGVAVVRVGRGDKVSPAMEACTLDALTAARKQERAASQAAEAERRVAAELATLRQRLRDMDAHELRAYAEQAGVVDEAPPPVRGAPHEAWFNCPSLPSLSGRYALTPRARQGGGSQPTSLGAATQPTEDDTAARDAPGKRERQPTARSLEHIADSQAEKLLRLHRKLQPGRLPPKAEAAATSASAGGDAAAAAAAGEAGDGRGKKRKAGGDGGDGAGAPLEAAAEEGAEWTAEYELVLTSAEEQAEEREDNQPPEGAGEPPGTGAGAPSSSYLPSSELKPQNRPGSTRVPPKPVEPPEASSEPSTKSTKQRRP